MTHLAAAIQMTTSSDKATNLDKAEGLIRLAAARGARVVGLPEVFNWRGKRTDEPAAAESLDGPTLSLMAGLARELEIHLLAGSITEHIPNETRRYNTSVLFGPDGARRAVYRKIHLFDIDLPGRVTIKESDVKLPGDEVVTVHGAGDLAPQRFRPGPDGDAELVRACLADRVRCLPRDHRCCSWLGRDEQRGPG